MFEQGYISIMDVIHMRLVCFTDTHTHTHTHTHITSYSTSKYRHGTEQKGKVIVEYI